MHGIVSGGGLSLDGERWVAGKLQFFGEHQALAETKSFTDWLKPLRQIEWVIYAKRPFTGPDAVLAYLSRYTHRVAIAISRLIAMNEQGITFKWKDYRAKEHYPVVITPSLYKYSSQLHPHRHGVGKMGITLL